MYLNELFKNTQVVVDENNKNVDVKGICYNTKTLAEGDIFVCLKGYSVDGHTFAQAAAAKGAVAILAEHDIQDVEVPVIVCRDTRRALSKISANFFENPSKPIETFGVTGTNGKTSITYMIRKMLESAGHSCGVIGTISYEYADKIIPAPNTTPESYELQKICSEMIRLGIMNLAMEVSSHALAQGRVADVDFDYGIFTNLTPDHLDFHNTLEEYYLAKKQLFYMTNKMGIINIDDPYGKRLFDELKKDNRQCVSYSLENKAANYYAEVIKTDAFGSVFNVVVDGTDKIEIISRIPGIFSVYNVLAACTACLVAGIESDKIAAGVLKLAGVPGRFETVLNNKNIIAIVDYAHTPDALENVLKTANSFKKGRLICVFGSGGDRDKTKRPLMGKAAGMQADYCILTSDNPRAEEPMAIIKDIELGTQETNCAYEIIENRYSAIKRAIDIYEENDVILVAGKGHEDYQIIGTEKIHFDDREALRELIG